MRKRERQSDDVKVRERKSEEREPLDALGCVRGGMRESGR